MRVYVLCSLYVRAQYVRKLCVQFMLSAVLVCCIIYINRIYVYLHSTPSNDYIQYVYMYGIVGVLNKVYLCMCMAEFMASVVRTRFFLLLLFLCYSHLRTRAQLRRTDARTFVH